MHEARGAAQAVSVHEPVLLRETIEALAAAQGELRCVTGAEG